MLSGPGNGVDKQGIPASKEQPGPVRPALKLPITSSAALHDEAERGVDQAQPAAALPLLLPVAPRAWRDEAEPEARPPAVLPLLAVQPRAARYEDGERAAAEPADAPRLRQEGRSLREREIALQEVATETLGKLEEEATPSSPSRSGNGVSEPNSVKSPASLGEDPSSEKVSPRPLRRCNTMVTRRSNPCGSSDSLGRRATMPTLPRNLKRRSTTTGLNARRFLREHGEERSVHDMYEFGRALGEGAWGATWEAWPRPLKGMTDSPKLRSQGKRAIKQLPKHCLSEEERAFFLQEVQLLKELDHPHICKLHEVFEDSKALYLVMELCEGGELFDRIVEDELTGEGEMAEIVRQIASALRYCHETHGIVHRDIKPENILFFSKRQNAPVKLIDFGLACHLKGAHSPGGQAGTEAYEAPEVLAGEEYDEKCDLWSLGTLVYVMLSGYMPFQSVDHAMEGDYSFNTDDWDEVSESAKDLISRLLVVDPKTRLSAAEALEHPWLQTAAETSSVQPHVLARLKNFQQISAFRKILLVVLSRQLATNDLPDMYEAFKTLDRDGDGMLSHKELRNALSTRMGSEELEQVLDAMDVDGSGCVDYSEFLAAAFDRKLLFREDLILQVFRALDRDESGTVGIQELHAMLDDVQGHEGVPASLREEARELLEQYDQDGDGLLNFEEFSRMLTRQTSADYLRDTNGTDRKGRPGLETWSVGQVGKNANKLRLSGTITRFKQDLDNIKQELSEKTVKDQLSEKTPPPKRLSGPGRLAGVIIPPESETPDKFPTLSSERLDESRCSSRSPWEDGQRRKEAVAAAARRPQTSCLAGCLAGCPTLPRWLR